MADGHTETPGQGDEASRGSQGEVVEARSIIARWLRMSDQIEEGDIDDANEILYALADCGLTVERMDAAKAYARVRYSE